MRLDELALRCGATVEGDGATLVLRVGSLERAGPGDIAFLATARYRPLLATTRAAAVIVAPADATATPLPKLIAPDPYVVYARVARVLHPPAAVTAGIDPAASIAVSARVPPTAAIGPCAVIGERAAIGDGASIGAHCVIGDDATIGEGAVLEARVTVYTRCIIGARTLVHSGAVIGADGFGLAEAEGRWIKIPQLGRVVVGADVEIGANTTIDRGAIDDTVIEDDVKLDNQIQIGHNCRIGAHTAIAGCVGIAGSTRIGRGCRIGGAAMISGHLDIADGAVISAATLIHDSIAAPGVYTGAFPALPHLQWRQVAVQLRRLRELAQRVKALERALARAQSGDNAV